MRLRKFFAAAVMCVTLSGCSQNPHMEYTGNFYAMNTVMTVTAYGADAEEAVKAVSSRITALEKMWSVTDEGSEIFAAGHSGGAAVPISTETASLLAFALDISGKTNGALDPTVYPVLNAWGFTTGENRVPTEDEISKLLQNIGYERVQVERDFIRLEEGMMLDFGAVAKGYAADETTAILAEHGIDSALINLGGNIQLVGSRPDGTDWRIGLKNPLHEGNIGVLSASDCAIVTSGNYERYFVAEDGTIYGHIIDPKSGYPVDNGLLSVTIIAKEGKLCDALSTALFVMGAEKASEFWRENRGFDMILMSEDNELIVTSGIADQFSLSVSQNAPNIKILE